MAKLLRDVAIGGLVKLMENGRLVEFYVAKHDYESGLNGAGRTLLVRKYYYGGTRAWHSSDVNAYASSTINTWLNDSYKNLFDEKLRSAIGTTKFYYTPGNGNKTVSTLSRSVFLLSATELGYSSSYYNKEGSALSIASTVKKTTTESGGNTDQWTRSPYLSGTDCVGAVNCTTLNIDPPKASRTYGVRPAFTLPAEGVIVYDDNTIDLYEFAINGAETDLGKKHDDFTINYIVTESVPFAGPVTVTEMLGNTVCRTHTVDVGAQQTMNVPVEGLWAGEYTVTVRAEFDGVVAERKCLFTVPYLWIEHDNTELGDKISNFAVEYIPETLDGTEMTITEKLDNTTMRVCTAASRAEQSMSISVRNLNEGMHLATITAESGDNVEMVKFNFQVPAFALHDGGTVQELQDETGAPVFPATLAKAVFMSDGKSVEKAISDLGSNAGAQAVATADVTWDAMAEAIMEGVNEA
ncbi:MAG: hypothetical protein IKB53_02270 [Oscillospiraceae bacterium]|nr:hypothetical protein [Oscillospiraceae bacterium]